MAERADRTTREGCEPRSRIAAFTGDRDRARFFTAHPELATLDTVDWLCEEINRVARADVAAAVRLLATAGWLAGELGSETARGRLLRAGANLLLVKRELAEAVDAYERARELFERAGDEREVVRTLSTGLAALTYLGEFERALEWADEARRRCEPLGEPQLRARLEFNVGHALAYRDRLSEALERFQSSHRHFVAGGRPADVAMALCNIAVCQQQLNRFEAALDTYREARDYSVEHGLERVVHRVDYNIAYLYFMRGEYTRAIRRYDEVRQRCAGSGDTHNAALSDMDEAEIFVELNLFEEAAALSRAAGAEFERLGMRYEAAKSLTLEAIAIGRRGGWQRADELLSQARASFAGQENRYWTALTDLFRAQLLEERSPGEAAGLVEAAHRAFVEIGLPSKIAMCELLQVRLAIAAGEHATARTLSSTVLERLAAVGLPALEYRAQFLAGLAAESAGRREEALASYRAAEATLEELRGQVRGDELTIGLSGEQRGVSQALFAAQLGAQDETAELMQLFEIVQRAKSRGLADLLAGRVRELQARDERQAELVEEINSLRAEASWFHRQLDLEESRGNERSEKRVESLQRAGRRRERRLLRLLRRLQAADPELGALQGAGSVPADELRAALPENCLLLEYFTARGVVYACVLGPDQLTIRPVCRTREVESPCRTLENLIGKFRLGKEYVAKLGAFSSRAVDTLLGRLNGLLIEPVADLLEARDLVVAPHGELHKLPFHAFVDAGGSRLMDRHSVSYAASATVFHHCARRPVGRGQGALVLGVPDERAPLIEEEARAVAAMLPGARLLLGDEASAENLVRLGERRRIVHIATHGLFRRDNPMFSAIRLGGSRLSLFDLYNLRLEADLVVLSGCSTGLSALDGADELVGLTRGLLYAGARAVIVALWDVDDESTCRLMTAFYRHLETARHAAAALAAAQREVRREYENPYYWAPFVAVGGAGAGRIAPGGISNGAQAATNGM